MLSQETINLLAGLEAVQNDYQPSVEVAAQLGQKSLLLFVGPSAIGKSTIIREVAEQDSRFGIAGSFTSRPPEERDAESEKKYTYLSHSDEGIQRFAGRVARGEVVQYAIHPTTRHIYGSDLSDYDSEITMLDTLSANVDGICALPVKDVRIIGLVAEPAEWKSWFNQRFPQEHPKRESRKAEAIESLTWLLDQPEQRIAWIVNGIGQKHGAATAAINIALMGKPLANNQSREVAERTRESALNMG